MPWLHHISHLDLQLTCAFSACALGLVQKKDCPSSTVVGILAVCCLWTKLGKREGRGESRVHCLEKKVLLWCSEHQHGWVCLPTRLWPDSTYSCSSSSSQSLHFPLLHFVSLGTTFSPASLPFLLFLDSSSFHGVWWQLAELSGIAALLEETWSEPRGLVGWDGIRASL